MTNYDIKFAKEMLIDSLIELAKKYESRLPNATQCVSCVASAMRAGEDKHLAGFLKNFETAIIATQNKPNH